MGEKAEIPAVSAQDGAIAFGASSREAAAPAAYAREPVTGAVDAGIGLFDQSRQEGAPGETEASRALKEIALVLPIYNEGSGLARNVGALVQSLAHQDIIRRFRVRFVLVDDGSDDETVLAIDALAHADECIEAIHFVRHFGKEAAILAGLRHAQDADAAIVMDSDLQHPPALIGPMLSLWSSGYPVVHGVKESRGSEGALARFCAETFYGLFRLTTGYDIGNHSDFKLLDQAVIRQYCSLPERRRFFRGLITWLGYPSAQIRFSVAPRSGGGKTAWSRAALVRYAVTALTDFSIAPLYLIVGLGVLVVGVGLVLATLTLLQKLQGVAADGFTTVIVFLFLTSGAVMVSLGLIGHYVGTLFLELKNRPSYLVRERPSPARQGDDGTT